MKKILLLFIGLTLLSACSEYQKVYNGKDADAKYKLAWKYYEAGKYGKADQLFSQVDKVYKRKPVYQRLLFAHAMTLYKMKYYVSAGEKFRKFTQLFPESSKAEEADYYIVLSYKALSPSYSVDQAYTVRAMEEIEGFLKRHPFSKYKDEVNEIYGQLQLKLEKKYYTIAKLYYDLERYKSAIRSFNNYLIDYPGSAFKEDALFYRFKAAADLALKSVESKKAERLQKAEEYYQNFNEFAKNPKYQQEADKLHQRVTAEINNAQVENK